MILKLTKENLKTLAEAEAKKAEHALAQFREDLHYNRVRDSVSEKLGDALDAINNAEHFFEEMQKAEK